MCICVMMELLLIFDETNFMEFTKPSNLQNLQHLKKGIVQYSNYYVFVSVWWK